MRYKRKKNYKRRRWVSIGVTAAIVVFAVWLGTQIMAYTEAQKPVDPSDSAVVSLEISEGTGLEGIAKTLEENGLIRSAKFFALRSNLERVGDKFKAGDYEFSRAMSVNDIMGILVNGIEREAVKFTIPEGLTTAQTMSILTDAGLMTEDEFWNEIENGQFDYRFLQDAPAGRDRLEGFLYPETYEVYKDVGAHAVVDMLLGQFDSLFTDDDYARAEKLKRPVREIITIASLIERETAVADERPVVARVIYNRLKDDMALQIDAAIQYALGTPREQLTNEDLEIDSPYNVYKNKGLPPGPICNPRKASVDAALHPEKNDYLFYVLDPALNGMHRFSASYDEFLVNKDAYQAALAARDAEEAESGDEENEGEE
ncbi:MAG: endolytic transglycosylase MltG [Clostridiales Family XIII bacterium]|jgi:UPF0755 protein|nr:endolytic transglycosylase MltG [Clostridiales Family XIII bacterium]